ncbi:PorT family protein [bacterium]|nr:PorT family protein [bacterium]
MKKIIMLFLLLSLSVFAGRWDEEEVETFSGGIKVGFGGSTLNGNYLDLDGVTKKFAVSFQFGAFFITPINDTLSFQSELLLDYKGADYDIEGINSDLEVNLSYLTVPLLIAFKANENLKIYAGGYISLLLNAESVFDSKTSNAEKYFNDFDYGVSIGAMFKSDKLIFDFRYNHGVANINNNDNNEEDGSSDIDSKNQQFILSLGYLF